MQPTPKTIKLIQSFEGISLRSYLCPAGVWTVGFGNTRHAHPNQTITQDEAEAFLLEDLDDTINQIHKALPTFDKLTENQQTALISFVFNLGIGNFNASTLKKKILANPEDISIATEFLRWNKANGKPLPGLTKRRKAESDLWLKP